MMVLVYGMADSCLYNKQNDTWTFGDMEFIFLCSHSISHLFDIDVNTRREIPYLSAPMYYSLYKYFYFETSLSSYHFVIKVNFF